MTIDTIPTGHAGESPGGFGAEGVCCESRIRVRESGKERDHIQGKLKGDSYTATTELWPQLSTETLLLTFPDDATVNQFSAAVTKIKENKVDQFIKSQVKCWLHCNELKILKWYFHQTPSMFSERTEESSASQWAASHFLNLTLPTSFLSFWDYPLKKMLSRYFQFYGYLSQQQNMMQDFVRWRPIFTKMLILWPLFL